MTLTIALVPVALLSTSVALIAAVMASLGVTPSPRVGCEPPDGVPIRVLCPELGEPAVVRAAMSVAHPALVVLSCDRFPDGVCQCDRGCFPLDLERRRPFAKSSRRSWGMRSEAVIPG